MLIIHSIRQMDDPKEDWIAFGMNGEKAITGFQARFIAAGWNNYGMLNQHGIHTSFSIQPFQRKNTRMMQLKAQTDETAGQFMGLTARPFQRSVDPADATESAA